MSMSVCLSVCLSTRITRKPHGQTSSIFVHVARGRGSVLLWRCYDENMTSSVKPEVHNISQRRQRMTEPRHKQHAQKIGEVRPRGFRVMRADSQTDILITVLRNSNGTK